MSSQFLCNYDAISQKLSRRACQHENITGFMHTVAVVSGGLTARGGAQYRRDCGTTSILLLLYLGMHSILNSGAVSTPANSITPSACHGTKNGTWANESDHQRRAQHFGYNNRGFARNPIMILLLFSGAENVKTTYLQGCANTDVNTCHTETLTVLCHNNSIIEGYDGSMGVSGGSPENRIIYTTARTGLPAAHEPHQQQH